MKADVASFRRRNGYAPTLAVVLVGRDAPSAVYLQQILRTCRSVGITGRLVEIPGRASAARLRNAIVALNEDPLVAGVIVQMPLPKRIPLTTVTETLDPAKDIDGIQPINAGHLVLGHSGFLPTTAQAAVEILKRSGIPIAGRRAVVVGRSNVVGKPAALLLLREDATVTVCHSQTTDLGVAPASGGHRRGRGRETRSHHRSDAQARCRRGRCRDQRRRGSDRRRRRRGIGGRGRLGAHAGARWRRARHERAAHDPPRPGGARPRRARRPRRRDRVGRRSSGSRA